MTTPTPTVNKVEEFRAEMLTKIDTANGNVDELKEQIAILAAASANLLAEITAVRNDVQWINQRMTIAIERFQTASASQPAKAGESVTFWATGLIHNIANGKHAYYLTGGEYHKHGIRVWPEVLESIGLGAMLDSAADVHAIAEPLNVRASVEDWINKKGECGRGPHKVIGLA